MNMLKPYPRFNFMKKKAIVQGINPLAIAFLVQNEPLFLSACIGCVYTTIMYELRRGTLQRSRKLQCTLDLSRGILLPCCCSGSDWKNSRRVFS